MAIVGRVKSFNKKFLFSLLIDGFGSMDFSKISGLDMTVGEVKHWEGGSLIANKSAGRIEFKDLTIERGASRFDQDMYNWMLLVANAVADAGLPADSYKRHATIVQRDRDGEIINSWDLFFAFPKEFLAGEWDNNTDEVVIEKMVLAYDYYVKTL